MAGLTPIELGVVLSSERFGDLLLEATDFTSDQDVEAGFVVYKDRNRGITYSELLHPDEEYLEQMAAFEQRRQGLDPEELREGYQLGEVAGAVQGTEPAGRMPELDLGRLIINDEAIDLRTDLGVTTHTHPMTHLGARIHTRRTPEEILLSSATDLVRFGEHLSHNPGMIAATAAVHSRLGGIGLYLIKPGGEHVIQQLQTVEPGTVITEERLVALGLRTARVTYDRHTGRPKKGLESIANLYPS